MGARVVDYRVSKLIVLCKDCGNDVGLYPARHKCTPIDRPIMPPLPLEYTENTSSLTSSNNSISTEGYSPSINRWLSRKEKSVPTQPTTENAEESIYFNNFAQNLPEANDTSSTTGKKLWGKVRQNDKWKQMSEKNEKSNQSGKLWGKLLQATQTMTEKSPRDDRGAESDEDDWEGETHVARILREHYEKNRQPLPNWLFDEGIPRQRNTGIQNTATPSNPARTPSRRRLWENNFERGPSIREKERMELRQQPLPPPLPEMPQIDHYRRPSVREQTFERRPSTREQPFERPSSIRDQPFERHHSTREQPLDRHSYNTKGQLYKERQDYEGNYRHKSTDKYNGNYERDRGSIPLHNNRGGYYEGESVARNYDRTDDYLRSSSPPSLLGRNPTSLRRAPDAGRGGLRTNNNYF